MGTDEQAIARGVGVVSIGLGIFLAAVPDRASLLLGMDGYRQIVLALGLRDLVIGAGLVSGRVPRLWVIARAVSDAADAVMLVGGATTGAFSRRMAVPGIGVALSSSGLGFWLSRRLR